jgi:hypothetical protein
LKASTASTASASEKAKAEAEAKTQPSRSRLAPEGGLEILLEEQPYARVRVRRCNMGPKTIVKEESEAIIMRALTTGLNQLENDYRVLLKDSQWITPNLVTPNLSEP